MCCRPTYYELVYNVQVRNSDLRSLSGDLKYAPTRCAVAPLCVSVNRSNLIVNAADAVIICTAVGVVLILEVLPLDQVLDRVLQ